MTGKAFLGRGWLLLMFFGLASLHAQSPEKSEPSHAPAGTGGTGQFNPIPVAPKVNALCVCQYNPNPIGCGVQPNPGQCRKFDRDCLWVGPVNGGACHNIHEFYCMTEFSGTNPRQVGCNLKEIQIIPEGEALPACKPEFSDYRYAFHGHGPRIEEFKTTVAGILKQSQDAPNCQFHFQDQTCLTFSKHDKLKEGLKQVRTDIVPELRKHLRGRQQVTLAANQISSTAGLKEPHRMRNPFWAFQFNGREITKETAVPCDEDILCLHHSDQYLCFDKGKKVFRHRVCCCKDEGFSERPRPRIGRADGSSDSYHPYEPPSPGGPAEYEDVERPFNTSACQWVTPENPTHKSPTEATDAEPARCPRAQEGPGKAPALTPVQSKVRPNE